MGWDEGGPGSEVVVKDLASLTECLNKHSSLLTFDKIIGIIYKIEN